MPRKLRRTLRIACLSLALGPLGNVQAGLILQNVEFSWVDFLLVYPPGDTTVVSGAELRWGTPHVSTPHRGLGGKSAIRALSRAPIDPVELDIPIEIADLLYFNANLAPPQAITSANLQVSLDFNEGSAQATYRLKIDETPDPVVGDSLGRAADTVSGRRLSSTDLLDDFNVTFQDTVFLRALEGGTDIEPLSILVRALPNQGVPEPSVLWMMATGLLMLLGTPNLRHRSKRRAVSDRNP